MTQKTQETYDNYLTNGKIDELECLYKQTEEPIENLKLLSKTIIHLLINEKDNDAQKILSILNMKLNTCYEDILNNVINLSLEMRNPEVIQDGLECLLENGKVNEFLQLAEITQVKPDFPALNDALQKTYTIQLERKKFDEFEFMIKLSGIPVKEKPIDNTIIKYINGIINDYEETYTINDLQQLLKITNAKPKEEVIKRAYSSIMDDYIIKGGHGGFYKELFTPYHADFKHIEKAAKLKEITGVPISEELIDRKFKHLCSSFDLKDPEKAEAIIHLSEILDYKPKKEYITKLLNNFILNGKLESFKQLKEKFNTELEPQFYTKLYPQLIERKNIETAVELKKYSGINFEQGMLKNVLDGLIKNQKIPEAKEFCNQTGENPDFDIIKNEMQQAYTSLLIQNDFNTIEWLKEKSGINMENETIKTIYKKVMLKKIELKDKIKIIKEIEEYTRIQINYQELI